jgi:hypothetical protein
MSCDRKQRLKDSRPWSFVSQAITNIHTQVKQLTKPQATGAETNLLLSAHKLSNLSTRKIFVSWSLSSFCSLIISRVSRSSTDNFHLKTERRVLKVKHNAHKNLVETNFLPRSQASRFISQQIKTFGASPCASQNLLALIIGLRWIQLLESIKDRLGLNGLEKGFRSSRGRVINSSECK